MIMRAVKVAYVLLAVASVTACSTASPPGERTMLIKKQRQLDQLRNKENSELDQLYDVKGYSAGYAKLNNAVNRCKTAKDRAGMAGKSITALTGLAAITKVMNLYWAGGLTLFATALNYFHDNSPITASDILTSLEKYQQEYVDARKKMNEAKSEADLSDAYLAGKMAIAKINATLAIDIPGVCS